MHIVGAIRKYLRLAKGVFRVHWEIPKTQKTGRISNTRPGSAQDECMGATVK